MKSLLNIKNLSITFEFNDQRVKAVKDSSFEINRGECVAIVGESGSGKSVTALAIMRLIRSNSQLKISGSATYEKKNLLNLDESSLQSVRGKKISMIFQEPMTSLNPLHNIEKQITECLALNQKSNKSKCIELLKEVGIENPEQRLSHFPHQLSGGQRQRVMIAMAIANNPDLLIADEPTTALDVTIQKQILDLLDKLRKKYKMSLLLITHDLGIVKKIANRVCVMEKGKIVEQNTQNKVEIGFMKIVTEKTGKQTTHNPYRVTKYLGDNGSADCSAVGVNVSDEEITEFFKANPTAKNIDKFPKFKNILNNIRKIYVSSKAEQNLKQGYPVANILNYLLLMIVSKEINKNKVAMPNFEPFIRECLQQNFIKVGNSINKAGDWFTNVTWPNRELKTGGVTIQSKATMTQPPSSNISIKVK